MKLQILRLGLASVVLLVSACSTQPRGNALPRQERPTGSTAENVAPESKGRLPDGEFTVLVESDPAGATVVVNGIPVGKAPQRIVLPGTNRGFFKDQVSVRVRFLATDGAENSRTVEEVLTPLDRIPAALRFTTTGARRVNR